MQDVSLLLVCHTCSASLLTCIAMCLMITSNLTTGFLINNLNFCYVWGLFYDTFESSIYYSYCLQAFYRLCRVVFYRKKWLISYSLFIRFIIGQWLLTIAILLPPIPLKWYIRLPTEKYCLIPYTDINAEIYHIIIIYVIPLICTSVIYGWVITFVRYISRTSTVIIAARQRQRNLRDLTIIKHIVILVSILALLRFPTIIFMIDGIIVGYLYPLSYSIVGLITSACLIVIGLMTIHITPPLRKNIFTIFNCYNMQVHVQKTPVNNLQTPIAVVGDIYAHKQDRLTNTSDDTGVEQNF